ncbi:MAG: hypothetical protein Q9216_005793 [Gyalolechia sp. 2 TL-2023]
MLRIGGCPEQPARFTSHDWRPTCFDLIKALFLHSPTPGNNGMIYGRLSLTEKEFPYFAETFMVAAQALDGIADLSAVLPTGLLADSSSFSCRDDTPIPTMNTRDSV